MTRSRLLSEAHLQGDFEYSSTRVRSSRTRRHSILVEIDCKLCTEFEKITTSWNFDNRLRALSVGWNKVRFGHCLDPRGRPQKNRAIQGHSGHPLDFLIAWPSHVCTTSLTTATTRRTRPSRADTALPPTICAVEQSDPRRSCRFLEPLPPMGSKELQVGCRPTADPPRMHSSQKRADSKNDQNQTKTDQQLSKPIKTDHQKADPTREPSKMIKHDQTSAFPTLAQPQCHRQPPNCSPESDHSHDCRSMFFISCSMEHGRDDCPLRVHTCTVVIPSRTICLSECSAYFNAGILASCMCWWCCV